MWKIKHFKAFRGKCLHGFGVGKFLECSKVTNNIREKVINVITLHLVSGHQKAASRGRKTKWVRGDICNTYIHWRLIFRIHFFKKPKSYILAGERPLNRRMGKRYEWALHKRRHPSKRQ